MYHALAEFERPGQQLSRELTERMLALKAEAHAQAGPPFNLGSTKQIGEILFGRLDFAVGRKTASGAPSTDEKLLATLAADRPLLARLLENRSLPTLKGRKVQRANRRKARRRQTLESASTSTRSGLNQPSAPCSRQYQTSLTTISLLATPSRISGRKRSGSLAVSA